jgi:hypothetical protein
MTTRAIAFAMCAAAGLIGTSHHAGAEVRTNQLLAFQCDHARASAPAQSADCDVAVRQSAPIVARAQRTTPRPLGNLEVIAGDPLPPTRPSAPPMQQTPAPAPPPPPPTTSSGDAATASKAD